MRVVLDACVLYPSVLRDLLLGAAAQGLYQPRWSERILEEWAWATLKLGVKQEAAARNEITIMKRVFPSCMVQSVPYIEARLLLPDPNDIHVFAVAIHSQADAIVTFNAKDFPRHILAEEGLDRRDPESFLWELWSHHPFEMGAVILKVHTTAEAMACQPVSLKALLKRAQLPRLAKAVTVDQAF
ncbi:MAG: PIN domain-containing protein [Rhodobacteraceae bacterium]|nr:PIN domain-containing protein [Paracoccaceae bacterium]